MNEKHHTDTSEPRAPDADKLHKGKEHIGRAQRADLSADNKKNRRKNKQRGVMA